MRRTAMILGAACLVGMCAAAAAAESASPPLTAGRAADGADDLSQIRAELASLRQRLDAAPSAASAPETRGVADAVVNSVEDCQVRPSGFYGGGAIIWAKPHMKESFQATSLNGLNNSLTLEPFSFDFASSFRVWLGWQNEDGLGLRARLWQYRHGGNPFTETAAFPNFPGASVTTVIFPASISTQLPGDVLTTTNSLKVSTLDIEATQTLTFGSTEVLGGLGLRYAALEQANAGSVSRGGAVVQSLDWRREFYGLGITASADGRRPITPWGLSAVGSGRAALLYGQKTLQRTVVGDVTPAPMTGPATVGLPNADEVSGIFELGLGLEWRHSAGRLGTVAVQGLYEGQLWTDGGAPTLTFLGFEGFSLNVSLLR
jgi:hypothetical protein